MSEERVAQVEMLIRFFNMQAGTSYKVSIDKNRNAVNTAIEKANGNIIELKNYVRSYANEQKGNNLVECFECFGGKPKAEETNVIVEPSKPIEPEKPEFAMAVLEKVIMQPIDLKRISFPLTHTGFFRVVGFDWYSKCPEAKHILGYGHSLDYDFGREEMQKATKELFGDNAVWFGCVKVIEKNEDYINEVLINAGNKKSSN